jgi:hypothetical protein
MVTRLSSHFSSASLGDHLGDGGHGRFDLLCLVDDEYYFRDYSCQLLNSATDRKGWVK